MTTTEPKLVGPSCGFRPRRGRRPDRGDRGRQSRQRDHHRRPRRLRPHPRAVVPEGDLREPGRRRCRTADPLASLEPHRRLRRPDALRRRRRTALVSGTRGLTMTAAALRAPTQDLERPGRHPAQTDRIRGRHRQFPLPLQPQARPVRPGSEQRDQPVVPQASRGIARAPDWEGFRDPAALNYRRYIALQHESVRCTPKAPSIIFRGPRPRREPRPGVGGGARKGLPASPFRLPRPADHVAVRRPARAERLHHQRRVLPGSR